MRGHGKHSSVLEMIFAERPIVGIQETNLSTNKQLRIMPFHCWKFILWSLAYPQELPVQICGLLGGFPFDSDISQHPEADLHENG